VAGITAIVEGHRRMVCRQTGRHRTDLFADSPLHDALTMVEHDPGAREDRDTAEVCEPIARP
jgi:hypothetical protein